MMNNMKYCILILWLIVYILSSWVNASRKKTACTLSGACNKISTDYTEPYCLSMSDPNIDSSIDHTECIRVSLNNNLSSLRKSAENETNDRILGEFQTSNLIKSYCNSLLWYWTSWRIYYAKPAITGDTWDWQQTFDSHQSLFVYALCSSFKDKEWNSPFLTKNALLSWAFKDVDLVNTLKLKQRSKWKDLCSLTDYWDLSDCDMAIYATEIYSAIMTDIFKIKYAQVLHVDTVEDFAEKSKDKVTDFMTWYFSMTEEYKILKEQFPQTIDVLESNQKYYKKVLDTVKIIDNSSLADRALSSNCPITWNMTWVDFIACALHSSQKKWFSLTPSFVTMIYNEILNYSIFKTYIQYWIEHKALSMYNSKIDEKQIRTFRAKSTDFLWYANLQIDSTKRALHTFEEFNMSYPLHIWLLMYQEKMKRFRDLHLSPIVTLFYSLSEKLQNVQLPN